MAKAVSTETTAFEREKWRDELRLREREVELRGAELDHKQREDRRSRIFHPLVLAIVAAALAAAGNALVAYLNGTAQQSIEERRAEAARVLEAIKTGNDQQAAVNLTFLSDVGLISSRDISGRVAEYIRAKKSTPTLPGAGAAISPVLLRESATCVTSWLKNPVEDPERVVGAVLDALVPDPKRVERTLERSSGLGWTGRLRGRGGPTGSGLPFQLDAEVTPSKDRSHMRIDVTYRLQLQVPGPVPGQLVGLLDPIKKVAGEDATCSVTGGKLVRSWDTLDD